MSEIGSNLPREAMASASFRDSINSLGWSRRNADLPVNTSRPGGFLSSLQSLNPFGERGYVQLPTTESPGAPLPAPSRREEEEGWFACESAPSSLPTPTPHVLVCLPAPCRQIYRAGHVPAMHARLCLELPHSQCNCILDLIHALHRSNLQLCEIL